MRSNTPDQRTPICWLLFLFLFTSSIGSVCAIAADNAGVERDIGQIESRKLKELSGLAASRQNPDVLWTHNDGKTRLVFAVHTSGDVAALVSFPVETEDFEDLAIGPGPKADTDYLYIGDIGDNNANRREIRVVRFAEPKLSEARNGQIEVEAAEEFRFKYPDGAHNAEALIVDPVSGDLFIVTKEKRDARLYTCPADQLKDKAVVPLKFIDTLDKDIYHVTGGAIARDGSRIIIRRGDWGWLWNRARGQSVAAALKTTPQRIPVRGARQGPQGEAVGFSPDGHSYYTVSEGKNPIICEFELPAPASDPKR